MSSAINQARASEVSIFARFIGDADGELPPEVARYFLGLKISDRDKARMHDLVVRNQEDALSSEEKEELLAFGRAGDMLAILKSKSRKVLGVKPRKPKVF
jgi:hypothetical protein